MRRDKAALSSVSFYGSVEVNPTTAKMRLVQLAEEIISNLIRHDPRTVGKMAGHVVLPSNHRVFSLMKRWGLGTSHGLRRKHVDTYLNEFVFRYNRRFYRHVSFETMLGLASHHHPTSYWDIVGRDNPRKGVPTVRRQPRRRRTATGMQQDRSSLPQNSRASTASGAPLLKR